MQKGWKKGIGFFRAEGDGGCAAEVERFQGGVGGWGEAQEEEREEEAKSPHASPFASRLG